MARQEAAGHFGLPGMRERAAIVNGQLDVRSERGAGTEIELARTGENGVPRAGGLVVSVANTSARHRLPGVTGGFRPKRIVADGDHAARRTCGFWKSTKSKSRRMHRA